jgi:hypothetical protein
VNCELTGLQIKLELNRFLEGSVAVFDGYVKLSLVVTKRVKSMGRATKSLPIYPFTAPSTMARKKMRRVKRKRITVGSAINTHAAAMT